MKRIIFLCVLDIISCMGFAQSLPGRVSVHLPKVLEAKVLKERDAKLILSSPYGQKAKNSVETYWDVFSDRANNITFTSPNATTQKATLSLADKLRIAEIQGEWAHVYVEVDAKVLFPAISGRAVDKGWIRMDHLLLWSTCLADSHGINQKALLCMNLNRANAQNVYAYHNPELASTKRKVATDMRFYFVMKRQDSKILLAEQNTMNGSSSRVLYGWVDEGAYVPWNQRTCLEPTWEDDAVYTFARNNYKAVVSVDGSPATSIPFIYDENKNSEEDIRWDPRLLRFPVLDGSNSKKYDCYAFTTGDGSPIPMPDPGKLTEWEAKEKMFTELKKVNLIFVVDGTRSMEKYYKDISQSIISGISFFDQKYTVKVGAMIFRDNADGQFITEKHPLTDPTNNDFHQWFIKGGSYGIKSSSADKSMEEDLNYGINQAIKGFRIREGESTIMIVIGDCGNNDKSPKSIAQAELIKSLAEKKIQMVAFQVRRPNQPAFNKFTEDMRTIIRENMKLQYDAIVSGAGSAVKAYDYGDKMGRMYQNAAEKALDQGLKIAKIRYPLQGDSISPSRLRVMIENTVLDYATTIQKQLDIVYSVESKDNPETPYDPNSSAEMNAKVLNDAWVKNRLKELGWDPSSRVLLGLRGTTPVQNNGKNVWASELYISSNEFEALLKSFEEVEKASRSSNPNNRKPFIDAIIQLAVTYLGEDKSVVRNMDYSEIMSRIYGLNNRSETMNKYTLKDISDPSIVTDSKFQTLTRDFLRKYKNLYSMRHNHYKFTVSFNNATYYWVPVKDLP